MHNKNIYKTSCFCDNVLKVRLLEEWVKPPLQPTFVINWLLVCYAHDTNYIFVETPETF